MFSSAFEPSVQGAVLGVLSIMESAAMMLFPFGALCQCAITRNSLPIHIPFTPHTRPVRVLGSGESALGANCPPVAPSQLACAWRARVRCGGLLAASEAAVGFADARMKSGAAEARPRLSRLRRVLGARRRDGRGGQELEVRWRFLAPTSHTTLRVNCRYVCDSSGVSEVEYVESYLARLYAGRQRDLQ